MDATKIQLSKEEMELVCRPDWILTKNRVLEKTWQLLETVQHRQQPSLAALPEEVRKVHAKISKGENYKGLPYLILDQPRHFSGENIFAIRSMFWWGHFFSSTLHLSGHYKNIYEEKIIAAFPLLQTTLSVCVSDDPWQHHFDSDNYIALNNLSPAAFENYLKNSSFIKLSRKIPLEQWDTATETLIETGKTYLRILNVEC